MEQRTVIIIGGGASGLAAAIAAARQGARVTILEHMDRVGKKLLSTGNGRCNLTNLALSADCYHCSEPDFPMQVLKRFSVRDTLAFFDSLGVVTRSKNGYIYPNSEQASAVLDALRLEAYASGVTVVTGCDVQAVKKTGNGFRVQAQNGSYGSDALILAAGSRAAPATGSDGSGYELARSFGHRIIRPLPALVQLRCAGPYFKQLAGVRCEARVTLISEGKTLASDTGELQLTDYGISGIPTFQVSRYASAALADRRKVFARLDFLPSWTEEETARFLKKRRERFPERPAGEFLNGVIHKKLAGVFYKIAGFSLQKPVRECNDSSFEKLAGVLKHFTVPVTAANSFEQAQVCSGGVDVRDVDPSSLESRLAAGLYLAGELLDVDGICGGYNLQWAWSTGVLAGTDAGKAG